MSLKTYRKNKEKVWLVLGNKCSICGCRDNLQLDHIDPLTKKFDVTPKLGHKLGPLWEEIHKCQLLCEPCHKKKNKDDQEVIQMKRKEFMHVNSMFDPILQENMCDITIDLYKKDGKAYMKLVEYLSEKTGDSVEDTIIRLHDEFELFNMYHMFCEWDNLEWRSRPTKESEKEFKKMVTRKMKKVKKEQPKFYNYLESVRDKGNWLDEDSSTNEISFSKMVDRVIDNDRGLRPWDER